jgi:DNA helicase II / ATP-dependent DNA helicase PcrA
VIRSEYQLSEEQEAAVLSNDPAIVVVASAGSGKTEVAARRVERLLAESPGEAFRVLALSYTLKAADELRERFQERLGELHKRVDTNTVHGFAHSLLRQHGTRIGLPVEPEVLVRDEDRAELLARWLETEGRPVPDDLVLLLQRLDVARARLTMSARSTTRACLSERQSFSSSDPHRDSFDACTATSLSMKHRT